MNTSRLLFTHALSPLHPGTGQGVGVIDLPIAREKATGIPYLPGSSVKGVLRDACRSHEKAKDHTFEVFGPDTDNAGDHAGTLHLSDQRLLLLPVRSFAGTFAWVTSPYILARFARDIAAVEKGGHPNLFANLEPSAVECLVDAGTALKAQGENVFLEDLDLKSRADERVSAWAAWIGDRLFPSDADWQGALKQRLCVVGDDVFAFLAETGTEVTARIKLQDDTKTVQEGALWYEESLPAETVLHGIAVASPVKKVELATEFIFTVVEYLTEAPQQFGGKASVGRGLCRMTIVPERN
jgi:CRISPR-associated protein Cmr4